MFNTDVCRRCEASSSAQSCTRCAYRASRDNITNGFGKLVENHEKIYHGVCSSKLNKEAQKDYNAMLSVMAEAVRVDREARERQAGEIFWVDTYKEEQRKKQVTKDEALVKTQEENEKLRRLMATYKRSNTVKDKLIEHLRLDVESLRLASFEILGGKK